MPIRPKVAHAVNAAKRARARDGRTVFRGPFPKKTAEAWTPAVRVENVGGDCGGGPAYWAATSTVKFAETGASATVISWTTALSSVPCDFRWNAAT